VHPKSQLLLLFIHGGVSVTSKVRPWISLTTTFVFTAFFGHLSLPLVSPSDGVVVYLQQQRNTQPAHPAKRKSYTHH
jgi:hypothetical protein